MRLGVGQKGNGPSKRLNGIFIRNNPNPCQFCCSVGGICCSRFKRPQRRWSIDMAECRRLATHHILWWCCTFFPLSLPFLFLSIDKFPPILFSGLHELWHLQTVYYTVGQKTENSHLSRSPIYYIYGTIGINLSHQFCSPKAQNIINTSWIFKIEA